MASSRWFSLVFWGYGKWRGPGKNNWKDIIRLGICGIETKEGYKNGRSAETFGGKKKGRGKAI